MPTGDQYTDIEIAGLRSLVLELCDRVSYLENELARARLKAQENWDILETVATGTKMKCAVCDCYKPCLCDK